MRCLSGAVWAPSTVRTAIAPLRSSIHAQRARKSGAQSWLRALTTMEATRVATRVDTVVPSVHVLPPPESGHWIPEQSGQFRAQPERGTKE
ncbi:MAG: hypothetical protein JWQ07_5673 [Ramlibacter sp.]|nr:hypothetical protein [Ramlibacter sp.]